MFKLFQRKPGIVVKHCRKTPLQVVEQLRDYGFNCIEEQYSNAPVIREQVLFEGKTYNSFHLPLGKFRLERINNIVHITVE